MYQDYEFFHFDFFAGLILTGAVQGMFLFILLIAKPQKQPFHYLILAMLVLSCSLIVFEIFLGYSGLMAQVLVLVDFSEPLIFVIGPLIFLLIRSMGGDEFRKKEWLHFIPFVLYFFYHLLFLLESNAVKFNAFLWAFHPEIEPVDAEYKFPFDPFYIRRNLSFVTLFHFGLYLGLAAYRERKQRAGNQSNPYFLSWIKVLLGFFSVAVVLYFLVKFSFQNDLGDHFLAIFLTVMLFFISYKMLTDSGFFQPVVQLKYEKSSLSEENRHAILDKLVHLEQTGFYLEPSVSLSSLAKQLKTSPHYLSQVLNEGLGKSFFEYIGQLRIAEAKRMLKDPATGHLKIEEIAERSGYLSKSAFSAAFKKNSGISPGEFRKTSGSSGADL